MNPLHEIPPDRDEQAATWCLRLAEGELPRRLQEEFDAWNADPENAKALDEATITWTAADAAADMPEIIHFRTEALDNLRRVNLRRWRPRLLDGTARRFALVACLLVAIVSVGLVFQNLDQAESYRTDVGERRLVVLADGSKLSLDADTEVTVLLKHDRRDLTLMHGRAKFDVAKDPLRPFTVTAGNKVVVATGTSFSVEMVDNTVHVLLYSGHVAILSADDHKAIQVKDHKAARTGQGAGEPDQALEPGSELIASVDRQAPASIKATDRVQSLAWEAGQLAFNDEPLSSVVERSNRYSSEKIVVEDTSLRDLPVNGIFTAGDTEALAAGLAALHKNIEVEHLDGKIVLKRE